MLSDSAHRFGFKAQVSNKVLGVPGLCFGTVSGRFFNRSYWNGCLRLLGARVVTMLDTSGSFDRYKGFSFKSSFPTFPDRVGT